MRSEIKSSGSQNEVILPGDTVNMPLGNFGHFSKMPDSLIKACMPVPTSMQNK